MHTVFDCEAWQLERENLSQKPGVRLSPKNMLHMLTDSVDKLHSMNPT